MIFFILSDTFLRSCKTLCIKASYSWENSKQNRKKTLTAKTIPQKHRAFRSSQTIPPLRPQCEGQGTGSHLDLNGDSEGAREGAARGGEHSVGGGFHRRHCPRRPLPSFEPRRGTFRSF